jgi:hypothetical protein
MWIMNYIVEYWNLLFQLIERLVSKKKFHIGIVVGDPVIKREWLGGTCLKTGLNVQREMSFPLHFFISMI